MNEKLIKLLQLTLIADDPEALVAIRKANRLLKSKNMDWRGFFASLEAPASFSGTTGGSNVIFAQYFRPSGCMPHEADAIRAWVDSLRRKKFER